jgi:hypothetical protein
MRLTVQLLVLVSIDIVLLLIWYIPLIYDYKITTTTTTTTPAQCSTTSTSFVASTLLLCFKAIMLTGGLLLAWRTRAIPVNLNESKYITGVIYNSVVFGLLYLGLSYGIVMDPAKLFIIKTTFLFSSVVIYITLLFGPKIYAVILSGAVTSTTSPLNSLLKPSSISNHNHNHGRSSSNNTNNNNNNNNNNIPSSSSSSSSCSSSSSSSSTPETNLRLSVSGIQFGSTLDEQFTKLKELCGNITATITAKNNEANRTRERTSDLDLIVQREQIKLSHVVVDFVHVLDALKKINKAKYEEGKKFIRLCASGGGGSDKKKENSQQQQQQQQLTTKKQLNLKSLSSSSSSSSSSSPSPKLIIKNNSIKQISVTHPNENTGVATTTIHLELGPI